nr:helix-turn-helix domain-containing protein [uncultured Desulfuromonas sp.]
MRDQSNQFLTVKEFANALGVSRQHVYDLIDRGPEEGGIRAFRFGSVKLIRIPHGELERYVAESEMDVNA